MHPVTGNPVAPPPSGPTATDLAMRKAAQDLEAGFLAEMLKTAGLGVTSESFGGGSGEDQFSSFLIQAYADKMAAGGGIGLAESFFNAMKEQQNGGR